MWLWDMFAIAMDDSSNKFIILNNDCKIELVVDQIDGTVLYSRNKDSFKIKCVYSSEIKRLKVQQSTLIIHS